MEAASGADIRLAALGPWAHRRIAFHATSTFSSSPAMEPLNEPVVRGGGVGGGGSGVGRGQQQQQLSSKQGKSDPQILPSSMPLQWTTPQKIGAGLSNLGNTCFLNSVLQCLTYTPPLAGYLLSGQHKASCRVAGFCAFCALQEHVQHALASSGKVVSPQKMAKNLRLICRSFRMGRQEDSHEYMRYLLEALHKCCLPPDLAKNSNSKSSQEKSLVYRIFGGQLRSQVKCTVCSHCSNTYDSFLDLSLEIVRADSLTNALVRFTAVDVLDGENKYRCPRCKKKVRALKHFTIDTVPNILTIQFKRFSSTGGHGGKIDKRVEFGTILDLRPFVSHGQDSVPKYKLFGVLVHSGWSTHSGHYYCFLRASSDIWHVFDDSRVRQVSERTVLEQKAYMLFYVREGKRAGNPPSESTPKQASSQSFSVLLKERERNMASEIIPRQVLLSRLVSVLPKESESKSFSEVLPEHVSSEPVSVPERRDVDAEQEIILMPTSSQSPPVLNDNGYDVHQIVPTISVIPSAIGCDRNPETTVAPVEDGSTLPGLSSGFSFPAVERFVPITEHEKETGICCTTSGNSGVEDDWDEYYKKGLNFPGGTPQNFLRMLRTIPHTRRYFQARALPSRRGSKVVNIPNWELDVENSEAFDTLALNLKKDTKRQHASSEELRGSKRRMDCSANCASSTYKESIEETCHSEILSTVEHEQTLEYSSLQKTIRNLCESNGSSANGCPEAMVEADMRVLERPAVLEVENNLTETDVLGGTSNNVRKDCLIERDSYSGAEVRVDASAENSCQPSHRGDGVRIRNCSNGLSAGKRPEAVTGSATVMNRSELYGTSVPRWDEVHGDEHLVKQIDRLLEPDKGSSYKQDIWDMEYDRGRSKKVRNKSSRESRDTEKSSGIEKGSAKSENPFQAFRILKQNGNGTRAGQNFVVRSGRV